MFQGVLVPLDGSALAERALDCGADASPRYGARLTLLRAFAGPHRATQVLLRMPPVAGITPPSYPHMLEEAAAAGWAAGLRQRRAGRAPAVPSVAAAHPRRIPAPAPAATD